MVRKCPVVGCADIQKPGKLMCLSHWRRTPKPLRDEVWRTWKIHVDDNGPLETRLVNIRAYREAADAAVAWWAE